MNKRIVFAAFVLMLVSSVSAQTLQNFEYSPGNDFEQNLTGGESFSVEADFTNAVDRPVPVAVEVRVDGSLPMSPSGEEFDLSGSTVGAEGLEFSEFDYYRKNGAGYYSSTLNGSVSESFDSGVSLVFDSSQRIRPDNYSFDVKIRSEIGSNSSTSVNRSVNASQPASVVSGQANVTVNASSEANVTVQSLGSVSTQPPQGRNNFVGGVSVDVRNDSGEVNASGTVTISYSSNTFDDDDMGVYFYNDSSSQWEFVGGTHYPSNNSIVADVDHFSTYVAYSSQPEDDDDDGSGGGSSSNDQNQQDNTETTPVDSSDQEEDTSDSETGQDQSQGTNDSQQNQTGQQEDQDTIQQQEPQEPEQPEQPPATGLFTADTTSVVGGLTFLLVLVAAVIQYTGRYDFRELPEKFRS